MSKKYLIAVLVMALCWANISAFAAPDAFKSTPYPVPRFVSLDNSQTNVRTGPGKDYPIKWVFEKRGLPVEVILEFEHWRKIRDHEGQVGWIFGPLLSGKRSALITGKDVATIYKQPSTNSAKIAFIEPKVLVHLSECALDWCSIRSGSFVGWIGKGGLWGVYSAEIF